MNYIQSFGTFDTAFVNESMDAREFLSASKEIDILRNSLKGNLGAEKYSSIITEINQLLQKYNQIEPRFSSLYTSSVVRQNLIWLSGKMKFFYNLAQNLNIYGSSKINPKTMCTNGLNIVYHPEFVATQTNGAIRFVLVHEVLHCLFQHMTRRGERTPKIWNFATDYAINPILDAESKDWDKEFCWPLNEQGTRMGLFEEKYTNMGAEEIYDKLEKEGIPPDKNPLDDVKDHDQDLPVPDSPDDVVNQTEDEDDQFDSSEPEEGDSDGEEGDSDGEGGEENNTPEKNQAKKGDIIRIDAGPMQGEYAEVVSVNPTTGEMELETISEDEANRRIDAKKQSKKY